MRQSGNTTESARYWELWHQFRAASSANQGKIDALVYHYERLREALTQIANGERVTGEVGHRPRFGNPEAAADATTVRALRPYEIARRALAMELSEMSSDGEMCPACGRFVQFADRELDADEKPLRALNGGAHDCPEAIDFSYGSNLKECPEA